MSSRIIFLLVFLSLTLVLSIASAKLFTVALRLSPAGSKIALAVSVILPFLLIGTFSLSNISQSALARAIYAAVMALAGCAVYFLIAAGILGILYLGSAIFHFEWSALIAARALVVLASLAGIAGMLQTLTVRTVSYEISAPALGAWSGKRIAVIADTHFGLVNQTRLAQRTIKVIQKADPDVVLIAGDYFDGATFDFEAIAPAWKSLTKDYPVFYAPGNHEGYGNYGLFMDTIRSFGITTLQDEVTMFEGVHIAGFMYRPQAEAASIEAIIQSFGIPSFEGMVAINHPPTFYDIFNKYGFDLVVSGHSHRGQFWPIGYIVRGIYGKFFYGHHIVGEMHTVTTSGVGTFGPPLRLFNPPEVVVLHIK